MMRKRHLPNIVLWEILLTQQTDQFPVDEAHHCLRHLSSGISGTTEGSIYTCRKCMKVSHPEFRAFCCVCRM
jgi:hypothetical protein